MGKADAPQIKELGLSAADQNKDKHNWTQVSTTCCRSMAACVNYTRLASAEPRAHGCRSASRPSSSASAWMSWRTTRWRSCGSVCTTWRACSARSRWGCTGLCAHHSTPAQAARGAALMLLGHLWQPCQAILSWTQVHWNGSKVPVKDFKAYCGLYLGPDPKVACDGNRSSGQPAVPDAVCLRVNMAADVHMSIMSAGGPVRKAERQVGGVHCADRWPVPAGETLHTGMNCSSSWEAGLCTAYWLACCGLDY
jgi:hypothetical protein